jgi:tape measure domain-containing protein
MAFKPYSLPIAFQAQDDGSTLASFDRFSSTASATFRRVTREGETAGKAIGRAFDLKGATQEVQQLQRTVERASAAMSRSFSSNLDTVLGTRIARAQLAAARPTRGFTSFDSGAARVQAAALASSRAKAAGADVQGQARAAQEAIDRLRALAQGYDGSAAAAGRAAIAGRKAGLAISGSFGNAILAVGSLDGALGNAASRLAGFGVLVDSFGRRAAIGIGTAAVGAGLILAGRELQGYQARLKAATSSEEEFAEAQSATARIAAASRADLGATIGAYSRLKLNADQLGLSNRQLETTLTAVQQAISLSGANSAEASAAMTQFAQAIGSGKLAGDELRSLLENATLAGVKLVEGLNRIGAVPGVKVTIGNLRDLAAQGKITSDLVIRAFDVMATDIAADFARMPVTIDQSLSQVRNSFSQLGLAVENSTGILRGTASSLSFVARNMDALSAAAVGVATAMAVSMVPGLVAAGARAAGTATAFLSLARAFGVAEASAALTAGKTGILSRSLTGLISPAGLAGVAIGALAGALVYFASKGTIAEQAAANIGLSLDELSKKAGTAEAKLKGAGAAINLVNQAQARKTRTEALDLVAQAKRTFEGQAGRAVASIVDPKKLQEASRALREFNTTPNPSSDKLIGRLTELGASKRILDEIAPSLRQYREASTAAVIAHQQFLDTMGETAPVQAAGTATTGAAKSFAQLKADAEAAGAAVGTVDAANKQYAATLKDIQARRKAGSINDAQATAEIVAAKQARDQDIASIKAGAAAQREAAGDARHLATEQKQLREELDRIVQSLSVFEVEAGVWRRVTPEIEEARRAAEAYAKVQEALAKRAINADQAAALNHAIAVEQAANRATAAAAKEQPYNDLSRDIEREQALQDLRAAGSERYAEILARAYDIQDQLNRGQAEGNVGLSEALDLATELVDREHERARAAELVSRQIDIQVDAARSLQDALTGFLENPFGKGSLKSLTKSISDIGKRAFAETLSVKLFGDLGADVRDALTRASGPFGPAVADIRQAASAIASSASASKADLTTAADGLMTAARDLSQAADRLGSAAVNDNGPSITQLATTPTAYGGQQGQAGFGGLDASVLESLFPTALSGLGVVAGGVNRKAGVALDAVKVAVQEQLKITRKNPLLSAQSIGEVALFAGSLAGGKIGAATSAIQTAGIFDALGEGVARKLLPSLGLDAASAAGSAVSGAGMGLAVDSVFKLLGFKGSQKGGAIGGAIGGAVGSFIPGIGPVVGSIIGSSIGSFVGGLLKKDKKAVTTLTTRANDTIDIHGTTGTSAARRDQAKELGHALDDALLDLAGQFGTGLKDNFTIGSIGNRNDKYIFDPSGQGFTKQKNGAIHFDKAEDAVEYALRNAIERGVIDGMRDSTKRLISSGGDLQKGIEKALKFESIFAELKRYTDPVGAAIDEVNKQFAEYRKLAAEAGATTAELADIEKLYGIKRAEAVKAAAEQMTGTLKDLLKDLTYRGDTGLSLRTRESRAQAAFSPLAGIIQGGGRVDQDEFADAAQAYLDISREIYGSTAVYFQRLQDVTALTAKAIQNAGGNVETLSTQVQQAVQAAYEPATAPTPAQAALNTAVANDNSVGTVFNVQPVVDAIGGQNRLLETKLDAVISRLDRIASPPVAQPSATSFKSLLRKVARNI